MIVNETTIHQRLKLNFTTYRYRSMHDIQHWVKNHTVWFFLYVTWSLSGISKKLEAAAKKPGGKDIRPWIKSIVNHIYWISSSCGMDGELKTAKWLSIVNHITNKHEGHSNRYPKCEHQEITVERQWLTEGIFSGHIYIIVGGGGITFPIKRNVGWNINTIWQKQGRLIDWLRFNATHRYNFCSGQFYCCRKSEYPEKTTNVWRITDKLYHIQIKSWGFQHNVECRSAYKGGALGARPP